MRNKGIYHTEQLLKSVLKGKVSITSKTVVAFMIAGFVGISQVAMATETVENKKDNKNIKKEKIEKKAVRAAETNFDITAPGNLGTVTKATGIAIGNGSKSQDDNATAIGPFANAGGTSSMAFGYSANSLGAYSIALGQEAVADGGWDAIAIGRKAKTTGGKDGIAIGREANTTAENAIAIGQGSLADTTNTVSFGNSKTQRKLVNIADGTLATGSHDAVTGGQLFTELGKKVNTTDFNNALSNKVDSSTLNNYYTQTQVNAELDKKADVTALADYAKADGSSITSANLSTWQTNLQIGTGTIGGAMDGQTVTGTAVKNYVENKNFLTATDIKKTYVHVNEIDGIIPTGNPNETNLDTANGKGGATGWYATAIGIGAKATEGDTIAVGREASATAGWAMAIGQGANANKQDAIAIGRGASATAGNSIAIGQGSLADKDNTVSFGTSTTQRKLVNVADGDIKANSHDVVTGGQLFTKLGEKANANGDNLTNIDTWKTNLQIGTGTIGGANDGQTVTGTAVKNYVENKNFLTATDIKKTYVHVNEIDGIIPTGNPDKTNLDTANGKGGATGWYATAIGIGAKATEGDTIAVGHGASATSAWSMAIGQGAEAKIGQYAIAIGTEAITENSDTIAIGHKAKAKEGWAIAIGNEAEARDKALAFGYKSTSGEQSVALGSETNAGTQATAIGYLAKADKVYGVAIGTSSHAAEETTVALGWKAEAFGPNSIAFGGDSTTKKEFAIAFGDSSKAYGERSIAFGISAYADKMNAIAFGSSSKATGKQAIAMGAGAISSGYDSTAIGASAVSTGEDSLAFGTLANAIQKNAIAFGDGIFVDATLSGAFGKGKVTKDATDPKNIKYTHEYKIEGENSYAIGNFNSIAKGSDNNFILGNNVAIDKNITDAVIIGDSGSVKVSGGVALGSNSVADRGAFTADTIAPYSGFTLNGTNTWGAVSVGGNGKLRQIINLADGTKDTDAVNLRQLVAAIDGINVISGDDNISVTVDEKETETIKPTTPTTPGGTTPTPATNTGDKEFVITVDLSDLEGDVTAINTSLGNINTELGNKADANLGNISPDGKKVITDAVTVAAGDNAMIKETTDADGNKTYTVNVKGDGKIEEGNEGLVTGDTVYQYQKEQADVNNRHGDMINENARNIDDLGDRVNHVGSLGAALAGLHPMQYDPLHPNQLMAAVGAYRDTQAVAIGATHYFNENIMMTAGLSMGVQSKNQEVMGNLGLTWKIGDDEDREDRTNLPARYDGKQMASIYMMQTEMDRVLYDNQKDKEKIKDQAVQIEDLTDRLEKMEKMMKMLMETQKKN